jgi:hypothetical protein
MRPWQMGEKRPRRLMSAAYLLGKRRAEAKAKREIDDVCEKRSTSRSAASEAIENGTPK